MLIACGFCGTDLTERNECDCRRTPAQRAEQSHLLDVVRLAAELGGVSAETIERASRALREEPS